MSRITLRGAAAAGTHPIDDHAGTMARKPDCEAGLNTDSRGDP